MDTGESLYQEASDACHVSPSCSAHLSIGMIASLTLVPIVPDGWRLLMLTGPCVYLLILFGVGLHLPHRAGWKVGALFPVAAAVIHMATPSASCGVWLGVLGSTVAYPYNPTLVKSG